MNEIDFRIIKPIRRFDNYLQEDIFVVPCKVIEIGKIKNGKWCTLKIEIVHPITGQLSIVSAKSYKKTIEWFDNAEKKVPFKTQCNIIKEETNKISFVVYGLFNADIIQFLYGFGEDGFLTEEQIMTVFNEVYLEIREWLNIKK